MFNSKQGKESPIHSIIYILFVSIIIIFDIVIIAQFMNNMDIRLDMRVFNLKYNTIASRLIYSPDCFAAESSYDYPNADGTTTKRWQVLPGVLDPDKIKDKDSNKRTQDCTKNAKIGWKYSNLAGAVSKSYNSGFCDPSKYRVEKFLVKYGVTEKGILEVCMVRTEAES